MEVYEMQPEGTLAEVIDNTIYMSPATSYQHQKVVTKLIVEISGFVENNNLGECVTSPVDVHFGGNNALQPDILFNNKNNLGIVQDGKVKDAPDLVIEILLLDKNYDLETKKIIYEKFGVKEYFVVDPFKKK